MEAFIGGSARSGGRQDVQAVPSCKRGCVGTVIARYMCWHMGPRTGASIMMPGRAHVGQVAGAGRAVLTGDVWRCMGAARAEELAR
jgi:hypothetical protein